MTDVSFKQFCSQKNKSCLRRGLSERFSDGRYFSSLLNIIYIHQCLTISNFSDNIGSACQSECNKCCISEEPLIQALLEKPKRKQKRTRVREVTDEQAETFSKRLDEETSSSFAAFPLGYSRIGHATKQKLKADLPFIASIDDVSQVTGADLTFNERVYDIIKYTFNEGPPVPSLDEFIYEPVLSLFSSNSGSETVEDELSLVNDLHA